jgi:hypothetical protein
MWVPYWGMLVWLQGAFTLVSLDGICVDVGRNFFGNNGIGRWTWVTQSQQLATYINYSGFYYYEPYALCAYVYTDPFSGFGNSYPGSPVFVDFPNARYGQFSSTAVVSMSDGKSIKDLVYVNQQTNVYIGRTATELMFSKVVDGSDLTFTFYDIESKVMSPVFHLGEAGDIAVYAPDLGTVVSLHGDGLTTPYTLNVWSLDVVPYAISSVQLIANSVCAQGTLATYKCQVTGQQGELCVGQLVDWSISGSGTIQSSQSTTDATGTATVQVLYGVGDTADSTVTASVTC